MDESIEFYISELLKVTGMTEEYLRSLHIGELIKLYEERIIDRGMII